MTIISICMNLNITPWLKANEMPNKRIYIYTNTIYIEDEEDAFRFRNSRFRKKERKKKVEYEVGGYTNLHNATHLTTIKSFLVNKSNE
jgi:hypothetical protein